MTKHEIVRFRCTLVERLELEDRAKGDVSKYIRRVLFEEQEQALFSIERKLDELYEEVRVLSHMAPTKAEEVHESKAPPVLQSQPVAVPAAAGTTDPERQGLIMELESLRGHVSMEVRRKIYEQVASRGLPVWDGEPHPPSSFMAARLAEAAEAERRPQAVVEKPEPAAQEAQKPAGWRDRFRPK